MRHQPRALRALPLAAAALLLQAGTAAAQLLPVLNAGFEADATGPGTFAAVPPAGWQPYDPLSLINQNQNALGVIRPNPGQDFFPGGVPQGAQAAIVYLGAGGGAAGLQQTLASTLQPGLHYSLQVAVGNIASGTSLPGSSDGGGVFYNLAGFPGYRIELLAGDSLLAADHNGLQVPEGQWRTSTLTYDSSPADLALGQALRIRLINLGLPGTPQAPGIEVDFDDVQLQASVVPEPAAATLAALGLALLLAVRRRR